MSLSAKTGQQAGNESKPAREKSSSASGASRACKQAQVTWPKPKREQVMVAVVVKSGVKDGGHSETEKRATLIRCRTAVVEVSKEKQRQSVRRGGSRRKRGEEAAHLARSSSRIGECAKESHSHAVRIRIQHMFAATPSLPFDARTERCARASLLRSIRKANRSRRRFLRALADRASLALLFTASIRR